MEVTFECRAIFIQFEEELFVFAVVELLEYSDPLAEGRCLRLGHQRESEKNCES
jgi:hypothetical protein